MTLFRITFGNKDDIKNAMPTIASETPSSNNVAYKKFIPRNYMRKASTE